ncbi:MAG: SRPBCC domain-containing protein [Blastopirellula sp. JB062]
MEFEFRHSPQKVWRAITSPDLLAQWLLPVANLKLEQGCKFSFQAPPQPGWDGTVECRILEIDEPRKIVYAWVVGELNTVVTFTLIPIPKGTRLSLVHSGFKPNQRNNFAGAKYGWKLMGGKLVDLLTNCH